MLPAHILPKNTILPIKNTKKNITPTMNQHIYLQSILAAVKSLSDAPALYDYNSANEAWLYNNQIDSSVPSLSDIISLSSIDQSSSSSGSSPYQTYNSPNSFATPDLSPNSLMNPLSDSPLFNNIQCDSASTIGLNSFFPDVATLCNSPAYASASKPVTPPAGMPCTDYFSVSQSTNELAKLSTLLSDDFDNVTTLNVMSNVDFIKSSQSFDIMQCSSSDENFNAPLVNSEVARKKRDFEFLASLPPQLALKRRRTGNTRHKEKILAELLSSNITESDDIIPKAEPVDAEIIVEVVDQKPTDIIKDENMIFSQVADPNHIKRQKNTDAARRSRMRKILRIETLEGRVTELETENFSLQTKVAVLESEKLSGKAREKELADKVLLLEKQILLFQQNPQISFQDLFSAL